MWRVALAAARVAAQRSRPVAPAALRAVAAGPPLTAGSVAARVHAAAQPRALTLRPPPLARHQHQQLAYTRRLLTTTPKPAPTAGQRAAGAAPSATRTLLRAAASATATTLRSGAGWLSRHVPASAAALANALQSPGATRRALSLRAEAWWRAHAAKVAFAGGGILAYGVWRGATALATALGGVSETRVALAVAATAAVAALVTRAAPRPLPRHRAQRAPSPASTGTPASWRCWARPSPVAAPAPRSSRGVAGAWRAGRSSPRGRRVVSSCRSLSLGRSGGAWPAWRLSSGVAPSSLSFWRWMCLHPRVATLAWCWRVERRARPPWLTHCGRPSCARSRWGALTPLKMLSTMRPTRRRWRRWRGLRLQRRRWRTETRAGGGRGGSRG